MPTYCYHCECGMEFNRTVPIAKCNRTQYCPNCKRPADRDYATEHCGAFHRPGNWPMKSDAAGCGHDQVQEHMAHSVKIGIPTEFTKDGRAIFRSASHRKAYCEHRDIALYDRNGGYSDPQPKNR